MESGALSELIITLNAHVTMEPTRRQAQPVSLINSQPSRSSARAFALVLHEYNTYVYEFE